MAGDFGGCCDYGEMNKYVIILVCLFWLGFAKAAVVIDDEGHKVSLAHPAQRIISLAPDITELLFAAGAGPSVVGVMQGSDYPAAAKKIPIVATFQSIDREKIVSLQPDLVVVWGEGKLASSLKSLNIPVFISHQKKIQDIPETLKRFGVLAGTETIALRAANDFLMRYDQLQKTYSNKKIIPVFYQLWAQPLMTVTKRSWINDVITLCGGKNVFADLRGVAPEVDIEAVLLANPAVIMTASKNQHWKNKWQHWPQLRAVQKNRLYTLDPDALERASPRILIGAQAMCQALVPLRSE